MHQMTLRLADELAARIEALEKRTPLSAQQIVREATRIGLDAIDENPLVLFRPAEPDAAEGE